MLPLPLFDPFDDLSRVNGDGFGDIIGLIDANHLLGQVKHVIPQRYDDELAVFSLFTNVLTYNSYVLVVQSCVNFIHAVERGRLVQMQGKDEAKTAQSLLAT